MLLGEDAVVVDLTALGTLTDAEGVGHDPGRRVAAPADLLEGVAGGPQVGARPGDELVEPGLEVVQLGDESLLAPRARSASISAGWAVSRTWIRERRSDAWRTASRAASARCRRSPVAQGDGSVIGTSLPAGGWWHPSRPILLPIAPAVSPQPPAAQRAIAAAPARAW